MNVSIVIDGVIIHTQDVNPATRFELRFNQNPLKLDPETRMYDDMVKKLSQNDVQQLFDDLDKEADKHPPKTRQLYLALYRRLHG